jgi:hypothetical protein
MAYLFGLAVECGGQKERADALLNHFSDYRTTLDDGQALTYSRELHEEPSPDNQPRYWVFVFTNELKSGAATKELAEKLSEAGRSLLQRLRSAPPFRFAVTGVEPLEAINGEQLSEALKNPDTLRRHYAGLVVSEELIPKDVGTDIFEPFAPGYLWIPYGGERFNE